MKNTKFLKTPVYRSELGTRAKNNLIRYLFHMVKFNESAYNKAKDITLYDVLHRIDNLHDVQNCGDKTVKEIIEYFEINNVNVNNWR